MNLSLSACREVLGKGGEGTVYICPGRPGLVVKIYDPKKLTVELQKKIECMIATPPHDVMKQTNGVSIAWPVEKVFDEFGKFIGYIMPRIEKGVAIFMLYNPKNRQQYFKGITWHFLSSLALNLAISVEAVHHRGHVIGDMNEKNILVNPRGIVTLIDTDSFQVTDSQGHIYPGSVGVKDYAAPELLNYKDRTELQDRYALAIIIFRLLMEGVHPFTGIVTNPRIQPESRIDLFCMKHGIFPHVSNPHVLPPKNSPPFEMLYPSLQRLFIRSFVEGYQNPSARPTAREWRKGLHHAIQALRTCEKGHFYSSHLPSCIWCTR